MESGGEIMEGNFTVYNRKINYYETDKMAIVHHSNYIRFFEEARLDMMDKFDLNYRKMEDMGIIKGSRIVLKLLLGASLERLCAVGSSRLILTLSARYPALESSSSCAPGIALTCI